MSPRRGYNLQKHRPDFQLSICGFRSVWEQRKFSDVVDIGSGMDYKHLGEGDIPVYGTGGYMLSVDKALSRDKDAIGIGRKGTIDKPYILRAPFWTVDTLFYCIPRDNYDLDFTNCLFQNVDWKKKDESTGVPSLSKIIINSVETAAPSFEEQKKIGDYFRNIDNLITLHQRKYCVAKMAVIKPKKLHILVYSTNEWEQRKLGDQMYIKSRIGWQALTRDEYLETGDYYLITGTDIDESTHTVDLKRCFYVSKERYEMDDKIQVREGDIIVTKDGTIGKVAMVTRLDKPATLNSHLFVLRDLSGNLDNRYLLQMLNSHIFDAFVNSTKTGSTLTGLPQKTFVEFQFPVPNHEEQKLISGFFDNLDNLITLHQCKPSSIQNKGG